MKTSSLRLSRKSFAYPFVAFTAVFVIFPLLLLLFYAFTARVDGVLTITLKNFSKFFIMEEYRQVFTDSIMVGLATTLICFVVGYPIAYILSNRKYNKSQTLVMLFILPMWINFLLRTVATKELFYYLGIELGMGAVIFGMVYNFLPFMILPLYTTLSKMDKNLLEAASDLGAKPNRVFYSVIVPLSIPGIISGITMVFMPSISTYVVADLLSNNMISLFGNLIYIQVYDGTNFGVGSALSLIMFVVILLTMFLTRKYEEVGSSEGGTLW